MLQTRNFSTLNIFLLETFVQNLVSLILLNLQVLGKAQVGGFSVSRFLLKSLINKKCHKSRTINDTDVKIGPPCKLEKRNTNTSWKLKIISCGNFVASSKLSDLEPIWGSSELVSRCMVHDSWVYINNKLLPNSNWKWN